MSGSVILKCLCVLVFHGVQCAGHENHCEQHAYPPPIGNKVPEYDIDLDLPPEQRWTRLVKDKTTEIKGIIKDARALLSKFHAGILLDIGEKLGFLNNQLPSPYKEEITSIANATGISIADVFLLNIAYEITALCTSIVAQDRTGKLYHVRNLDMGINLGTGKNDTCYLSDALRAVTVNLNWKKNGKVVFKSTNYAGYIGILTAVKQGRFTFSINERHSWDGSYIGLIEWILTDKGRFMGFLSREVMLNADSFEGAIAMFTKPKLIAPAYFILGGNKPGQGVVITRNRETSKTDIWRMTDQSAGHWFIVETNSDHWNTPGTRKALATRCLNALTEKNVTLGHLFNVLSSSPVKNVCTTYTSLMQVDNGTLDTWIRH